MPSVRFSKLSVLSFEVGIFDALFSNLVSHIIYFIKHLSAPSVGYLQKGHFLHVGVGFIIIVFMALQIKHPFLSPISSKNYIVQYNANFTNGLSVNCCS